MRINQLIEHLCKSKKISQADLARRVGMQATHLNHFIRGRGDIRSSRLVKILQELDVDLSQAILQASETKPQQDPMDAELFQRLHQWPATERKALTSLIQNLENHIYPHRAKPTEAHANRH